MLSLVICRPGVFRKKEKEDFAELTIDLPAPHRNWTQKKYQKKGKSQDKYKHNARGAI